MKRWISTYRFFNIFSIDVSAGAVISSLFFSKVMDAEIKPNVFLALGLTVWIVYTIDHLLDVKRLTTIASTQRHKFHQQHFKLVLAILAIAIVIDGYAVLTIRESLFVAGLILSLVVAFYLLFQHFLSPFKEFFGGTLYTIGVILPAMLFGRQVSTLPHLLLVVQFFFTVCMNLLLFSMFDKSHDRNNNYISFATKMGEAKTRTVILITFCLSILLGVYQFFYDWCAAVILLLMSILLVIILSRKETFVSQELFRLVGDAVFFLPIFYFICK